MTNIRTIEKNGMRLEVWQDDAIESPRDSMDNLGTIAAWHRRYNLADDIADYRDPREFFEAHAEQYYRTTEGLENASDARLYELFEKDHFIVPIFMYEHGGIKLVASEASPFACQWDSGQVGYTFVSKAEVRKEHRVKHITKEIREKVLDVLNGELEIYEQYVNGDVYGFTFYEQDGGQESSGGYYGTDWHYNGMIEQLPEEFQTEF